MSTWVPQQEGTTLALSGVNAALTELETAVNAADEHAIQLRSLHHEHLPSPVIMSVTQKFASASYDNYDNPYPGWKSDTEAPGGGLPGWKTASDGSTYLKVSFDAIDLTNANVAGILILANLDIEEGAAYVKIQVQHSLASNWFSLDYTTRVTETRGWTGTGVTKLDIPIRTFLTSSALLGDIEGVRVRISTDGASGNVMLGACNLSVIAFYGANS